MQEIKKFSICIATFNREILLEKLLESLASQNIDYSIFNIEIIVTDNNPLGTAKKVVDNFIKNHRNIFVKFFIQPVKNISLTRNMSITNATGEFILFIDDDEIADENWINTLYNALIEYGADGVFGNVTPIYDNDIPNHVKKREFYFTPIGTTGTIARYHYTTNALIKSEILKAVNGPFDEHYGLTGGEDAQLFEKLVHSGAKFIYCKEAITYEFIPKNRGTIKYLFLRSLRGGQSFLRRKLSYKKGFLFKIKYTIIIVIKFILGCILIIFYPLSRYFFIKGITTIGESAGKFLALTRRYKYIY